MEEEYNFDAQDPYLFEERDEMQTDEELTEVLLREIEEEEDREAELREAAIAEAMARGEPLEKTGAQLTDFQEQIITTGSGVGKALIVLLAIAFVVKTFELLYSYMKRKAALLQIKSAISTTQRRSVDEYDDTNPNFDRLEYIEYNAEFKTAVVMDEKIRQGNIDRRALLPLLHQRTSELLHRRSMLSKNEHSVTVAYQIHVLPLEVWNDFQAAKEALTVEMLKVQTLAEKLCVPFQGLLESAHAKQRTRYKKDNKRKSAKEKKPKRRRSNSSNKSNPSTPIKSKSESQGRPMTSAEKARAKGLVKRRRY